MPKQGGFTIYDAKGLVRQLLTKEINVEQAVVEAVIIPRKDSAVG
jgi:hypothetical protein